MTANEKVLGFIRTYVPYGISAALAWVLLHTGLDLTGEVQVLTITLVVALTTNAYYLLVRLIESRWPWVGVFLGFPKQPQYVRVDNLWASLVRTLIPVLVSFVLVTASFYIAEWFGYVVSDEQITSLAVIVVALVEAAYYSLARAVIARWPGASWLLGTPTVPVNQSDVKAAIAPTYDAEAAAVATGVETGVGG